MFAELTPEQETQIPIYRQKWRQIALSTQRVDRQKAADAILAAYATTGIKPPKIVFCDSSYAAFLYRNHPGASQLTCWETSYKPA